jgi:hypothetical protein
MTRFERLTPNSAKGSKPSKPELIDGMARRFSIARDPDRSLGTCRCILDHCPLDALDGVRSEPEDFCDLQDACSLGQAHNKLSADKKMELLQ